MVSAAQARVQRGKDRWYSIDGEELPSVTSILAALSKPALVNWSGKVNRERTCDEAAAVYDDLAAKHNGPIPTAWFRSTLWERVEKRAFHNEDAKAAADLGTLAHARCEWIVDKRRGVSILGPDPVEVATASGALPPAEIDRALWASLAFEDWLVRNCVQPLGTEVVVAHKGHGYAGTADLIARVDGDVSVVDLKTSSGLWPDMRLQIAAYFAAFNDEFDRLPMLPPQEEIEPARRAFLLRLPKRLADREFEAVEVTNLDAHLEAFLALKRVWEWQRGNG